MKSPPSLDPTLAFMVALARRAGREVMSHYNRASGRRRYKADRSPVTAADLAANRLILSGLRRFDRRIPVISEESPVPRYAARIKWKKFWLVDPVDGTREFLKRTGNFTVNIALIDDGVPTAGVVYAPAHETLYCGSLSSRSWKQQRGRSVRIYPKVPRPGQPPTILLSRLHENDTVMKRLARIPGVRLRPIGSSIKFGLLAEGKGHAYLRFGPTSEWDVAAGDAVWRYAGDGQATNPSPLKYNKKTLTNGSFCIGWRPIALDRVPK